jgi:hypothetical protein
MRQHVRSYYIFGVIYPLLLQITVLMAWSFLPKSDLIGGRISLWAALDEAASLLAFPVIGLGLIVGGVIAIPFGFLQVLCARSLGRSGATTRELFLVGLLNPSNAIIAILIGLVAWGNFSS